MASTKQNRLRQLRKAQKRRRRKERLGEAPPPATLHTPAPPATPPIRMSDVIEHVAQPLFDECGESPEELERVVTLTIAAWNLTLFSPEIRERRFQEFAELFLDEEGESDPEMVAVFCWICDVVAERKAKFYPHVNRLILNLQVQPDDDGGIYFQVAHTEAPN